MELLRVLGRLAEPPDDDHDRLTRLLHLPSVDDAAFTDLFVLQLYPYASVHLGPEGMLGGIARDRVAGFFRSLGVNPPAEPDHLAVLLGAAADLADREREATDQDTTAAWRRSRAALLWEHLLSWAPPYLDRVAAHGGPYAPWAELLLHVLRQQAETVGPPAELPLQLRAAPGLDDPRTAEGDADQLLDQLLAPVRTGIVLTRSDLVRAARDLGAGARIGERRYVLSALFSQAPADVLAWLAAEADRRATAHARHSWTEQAATFWRERAAATSVLLASLAEDASHLERERATA